MRIYPCISIGRASLNNARFRRWRLWWTLQGGGVASSSCRIESKSYKWFH